MLKGEYETTRLINQAVPDLMPQVIGIDHYHTRSGTSRHFLVSEFIDLDHETRPDPRDFGPLIAHFHQSTIPAHGFFGFHTSTYLGPSPYPRMWSRSWAAVFSAGLEGFLKEDAEHNGPWEEMNHVAAQLIRVVIPRLLGDLRDADTEQPIKPCLLHGDLWDGNSGICKKTKRLMLFDAGGSYGHNECDLGHMKWEAKEWWSGARFLNDPAYFEEYRKIIKPSLPQEECEDRYRLYRMRPYLAASSHWGEIPQRDVKVFLLIEHLAFSVYLTLDRVYNDMCYLCAKYAPRDDLGKYDPTLEPVFTK